MTARKSTAGGGSEVFPGAGSMPAHAEVLTGLRSAVERDNRWRWLELACSLATGRGDELSDIDIGVGFAEPLTGDEVHRAGVELVAAGGAHDESLVHAMPGWPAATRRFAVEYANGVQLDLVLIPAGRRNGLPPGSLALVDKDRRLAEPAQVPLAAPPEPTQAREWTMLGWWALSDVAKYLRRGSLFEAVERISEARQYALQLFAAGQRVPYPSFGLVSLLDYPPGELPVSLADTYCVPASAAAVAAAATATADLLAAASGHAAAALGADLDTTWAELARRRLAAAPPTS